MPDRTVLVTGASGAVGPGVVRAFLSAGWAVRALSVDPPRTGDLPLEAEVLIGDVCSEADVRSALEGVGAVVHLAALLHQPEGAVVSEAEYWRVNVGGTEAVARAATEAQVRRIVLLRDYLRVWAR